MSLETLPPRPDSDRTVRIRRRVLLGFWLLCVAVLMVRAVDLQVVQGSDWREAAERQHRTTGEVPAARGAILDRTGVPLALSHETFQVSIAPHEVADTARTVALLAEALEIQPGELQRRIESDRRWVPLPGRYAPHVRDAVSGARGVYVARELRRFHPHNELVRGVLGAVIDDAGTGGIEQAFDEQLSGVPGLEVLARDSEGRPIPGETWLVQPPRAGGQVVLTLDADLQEIAHEALREAIGTTGSRGGDLIVTDPRTGEILAMVSVQDGTAAHLGGINTPYEPGSTLKPFTVAALLELGRASLADSVDTGHGQWRVAGRTISDVSVLGKVDLAHALRASSNVAMAKMVDRLTPAEQYEGLRDFGFGVPTGVELPGEVGGLLRRPQQWSAQSSASLAMGYEVSVTPLQMAMAYGALANGGVLMEPRLVKEVRDHAGRAVERFEPRSVRRVVSEGVAAELSQTLVGAVEDGTGGRARLATFSVAGKSGTTRAYDASGGYAAGGYYASFIGFFPAEAPQLVVFVKLDRPQGQYYGGATAAPVTRATMEAILASHRSPLDRGALAAVARAQAGPIPVTPVRGMSGTVDAGTGATRFASLGGAPGTVSEGTGAAPRGAGGGEPLEANGATSGEAEDGMLRLPDMRGANLRAAVRRLHGLGLVVEWNGPGPVRSTQPEPGASVAPGDTIRILGAPPGRASQRAGIDR
jgi:cell division protein FtsI (penicillin-binding protein 3)